METRKLTVEELLAKKDKRIKQLEADVNDLSFDIMHLDDQVSDLERRLDVKNNEVDSFKDKFGDFVNPSINNQYLLSTFIEKYEKYGALRLEEMLNKL